MSNSELQRISERLGVLSRCGLKAARTIDQAPPNSRQWAQAVKEAKAIAKECLRLAKLTGDPDLIEESERTLGILP